MGAVTHLEKEGKRGSPQLCIQSLGGVKAEDDLWRDAKLLHGADGLQHLADGEGLAVRAGFQSRNGISSSSPSFFGRQIGQLQLLR